MTEAQLNKSLYTSLWLRARANRAMPGMRFVDRAAEHLVNELGKKLTPLSWPKAQCRNALSQCQWVDACVQEVFERYPTALGVQPDAGLNTRFHRLSQAMSWPRFEWVDINNSEVSRWVDGLLPSTDNYRLLTSANPLQNWQAIAQRPAGQPLVMVLEQCLASARDVRQLLLQLTRISLQERIPVFMVITYSGKTLWPWGSGSGRLAYKNALDFIAAMGLPADVGLSFTARSFGSSSGIFIKINDCNKPT